MNWFVGVRKLFRSERAGEAVGAGKGEGAL